MYRRPVETRPTLPSINSILWFSGVQMSSAYDSLYATVKGVLHEWVAHARCCCDSFAAWPVQDIRLFRGCCAPINHPVTPPAYLHWPPWCKYYCTIYCTVYGSPPDLRFVCYTPYNIGNSYIVWRPIYSPPSLRHFLTQGCLPSVVVLGCGFSLPVCGLNNTLHKWLGSPMG